MPGTAIARSRANRAFGTDEKRIRTKSTVMVESNNGPARFSAKSHLRNN